ncbi:dTDP-4-dehydrorhamnose reductase [Thiorhodospira sibirica]|uniref:dTDP-4-dehydrorhamnose reductase n=1 Tax=Thiorhodospira sibirica TaxID=154347 RepID=UPI00022C049B|nr:dTDP-4-dehydrorhamnose reductase [Thiorhodospira sibirica]
MSTTVIVTGAHGQFAQQLITDQPAHVRLIAFNRAQLDITDAVQVQQCLQHHRPAWVINAAAYTAVDRAESETAAAFAVNAEAPGHLAQAAARIGARMLHLSTDYVFDGQSPRPYRPDDATAPINQYGHSKLAGERKVQAVLGSEALIVRTAWVYGTTGQNFLHTLLRLMRERDRISVVADQIGTPTATPTLSRFIWRAVEQGLGGLHHCTDAGVASWYDFAQAIYSLAQAQGLVQRAVSIVPISTAQYPTPARRPACALLDKSSLWEATGLIAPHWRDSLHAVLQAITAPPKAPV